MSEEKKLTDEKTLEFAEGINVPNKTELSDEEIVKAWRVCMVDDNAGCKQCPYTEKKIDCVLDGRHYKDTLDLIHRQKAEIERLTEENGYLKQCADNFLADYQTAQKQVDELTEGNRKFELLSLRLMNDEGHQRAVKDTAKEILAMFNDRNYITENELKKAIAERYGVSYEENN